MPFWIIGGAMVAQGALQYAGSKSAASATRKGMDAATRAKLEIFYKALELNKPYRNLGYRTLPKLEKFYTQDYKPLTDIKAPDAYNKLYNIQQQEAERNINKQLAARGLYGSGAGVAAISDFNRKIAAERSATGYRLGLQKALMEDERRRLYGQGLMGLVNIGYGATSQGAQQAYGTGSTLASLYQSGYRDLAGINYGMYSGLANTIGQGAGSMAFLKAYMKK